MPTNRRPPAAVPQAEETAYKRRMAICAFSDPATLARLTQSLQAEKVALSSLVAYLGRDRKFGFWGYLLASLLLSPIMGFLLVIASDRRARIDASSDATPSAA